MRKMVRRHGTQVRFGDTRGLVRDSATDPRESDIFFAGSLALSLCLSLSLSLSRSLSLSLSLLNDTSPMIHLNVMMHLRMLQCRMALAQDWTKA